MLKKLSPDTGYQHGDEVVPALAFADDLILFVSTRSGMECNLSSLVEEAAHIGFTLGNQKRSVPPSVFDG